MAALLADIGGTNARFALLEGADIGARAVLPTADHPGLADAAAAYLASRAGGRAIDAAAIAVAGPVDGDRIDLTNRAWSFTRDGLSRALGIATLHVVNDFTAQALALPALGEADLLKVGGGAPAPAAAKAVVGPGTGLGISGLVRSADDWVPLAGEGGHATLPATTDEESAVIGVLRRRFGHVSAERALSGPGLTNLYAALAERDGAPPADPDPDDITAAALAGSDRRAVQTVEMFCAFLGTVAADLALALGARGGVYIAGGIVPRLGEFFAASPFRARFEDKGRFAGYLAAIPTWVVTAETPALTGLARLLARRAQPS